MDDQDRLVDRLKRAAALVSVFVVVPTVVGALLGGRLGAIGLVVGMVGGLVTWLNAAPAWMLALPALALALGGLSHGTWWWVVVAAGFAALVGWSVRWGLLRAVAFSGLVAVAAKPIARPGDALVAAGFALAGAWLGSRVGARITPRPREPVPADASVATVAAVAFAVAVGLSAALAHRLDDELAYWIPLTVLVLAVPVAGSRSQHAGQHALGTVVGMVALLPLAMWSPPSAVIYLLAVVCLLLVMAVEEPVWVHAMLVTFLILLILAPRHALFEVAERRVLFTLVALGIVIVIGTLADRVARQPA